MRKANFFLLCKKSWVSLSLLLRKCVFIQFHIIHCIHYLGSSEWVDWKRLSATWIENYRTISERWAYMRAWAFAIDAIEVGRKSHNIFPTQSQLGSRLKLLPMKLYFKCGKKRENGWFIWTMHQYAMLLRFNKCLNNTKSSCVLYAVYSAIWI